MKIFVFFALTLQTDINKFTYLSPLNINELYLFSKSDLDCLSIQRLIQ